MADEAVDVVVAMRLVAAVATPVESSALTVTTVETTLASGEQHNTS